jgi:hypothetical protein
LAAHLAGAIAGSGDKPTTIIKAEAVADEAQKGCDLLIVGIDKTRGRGADSVRRSRAP